MHVTVCMFARECQSGIYNAVVDGVLFLLCVCV